MDAQAAFEFLLSRRDIDKRKIIVFGRSLGGAVAIYLAASPTYSDKYVGTLIPNPVLHPYSYSNNFNPHSYSPSLFIFQ